MRMFIMAGLIASLVLGCSTELKTIKGQYPHSLFVVERTSQSDIEPDSLEKVTAVIEEGLVKSGYKAYNEVAVKDSIRKEMAAQNIDPYTDQDYMRLAVAGKANLGLYFGLRMKEETGASSAISGLLSRASSGVVNEVKLKKFILTVWVEDLITAERYGKVTHSKTFESEFFEGMGMSDAAKSVATEAMNAILEHLAKVPPPGKKAKVLVYFNSDQDAETVQNIFRKMEKKNYIKIDKPFVKGKKYCATVEYIKDNQPTKTKLVALLQQYLDELFMKVEIEPFAIIFSPKDEGGTGF